MYIENINGPQDVKKLTVDEMGTLADEMTCTSHQSQQTRRTFWAKLWYGGGNHSTSLCI